MKWLKYLWIPFSIMVAAFMAYVLRRSWVQIPDPITEIEAITSEAKYKKLAKQVGAERAIQVIELEFQAEIKRLAVAHKIEADRLRADPAALAAFLIRASR